jgi:hypothetical protein
MDTCFQCPIQKKGSKQLESVQNKQCIQCKIIKHGTLQFANIGPVTMLLHFDRKFRLISSNGSTSSISILVMAIYLTSCGISRLIMDRDLETETKLPSSIFMVVSVLGIRLAKIIWAELTMVAGGQFSNGQKIHEFCSTLQ